MDFRHGKFHDMRATPDERRYRRGKAVTAGDETPALSSISPSRKAFARVGIASKQV